jgi:hypothetical protein
MSKSIINKYECLEISCRILGKYLVKPEKEVLSDLKSILSNYKNKDACIPIQKASSISNSILYDLFHCLRQGLPLVLGMEHISAIEKYIEHKVHSKSVELINLDNHFNIQKAFDGQVFYLYFADYYIVKRGGKMIKNHGIGIAELKFLPFGKALITSFNSEMQVIQKYFGYFEQYFQDKGLMKMEFLTDSGKKDLHILMDIGIGPIPELSIGQYHNFSSNILSGRIMMERVGKKTYPNFPCVLKNGDTRLPAYVSSFLSDLHESLMINPQQVYSKNGLMAAMEHPEKLLRP